MLVPVAQALQKRLSILEQRTVPSLERALESNRANITSKVRQYCTPATLRCMKCAFHLVSKTPLWPSAMMLRDL